MSPAWRRVSVVVGPALIARLALGCDGRGAFDGAATFVRDSSGIRVVENRSPVWRSGESWTIDSLPVLQIGMVEGEEAYQFTSIWRASRRDDGVIAVVDYEASGVRVFGSDGVHIGTIGRAGEGPGEFAAPPEVVWVSPDTLLTWDERLRRLTWFDSAGDPARERSLAPALSRATTEGLVGINAAWQLLSDGALLATGDVINVPGTDRHPVHFITAQGSVARLGEYEGDQRVLVPPGIMLSHSFAPHPYAAVRVQPFAILLTRSGRREITSFDAAGNVTAIMRVSVPRVPITHEMVEHELGRWRDLGDRGGVPPAVLERAFDQLSVPDSLPAVRRLFSDRFGNSWIQRRVDADQYAEAPFDVLDVEGRWLGTVRMPDDAGRVLEIGGDCVLTNWDDELGVDYLRLYRMKK